MNMRSFVIALLTCIAFAAPALAQTAEEVLEQVRKKYDTVNDAELRFSQTVRFSMSKVEQRLDGTLLMKKGNRYRVETDEMTVVTDGETVWSYSRINNQVLIDRFKLDERSFSPERILMAAPADFSASLLGHEKVGKVEAVVLKLFPATDQSFLSVLKLWVDEGDHLIRKVEMTDANGKETTYVVTEIRINSGVTDGRFTYKIPEGVETVDLR
jgi:outer membrane lipoprotein carrier protein